MLCRYEKGTSAPPLAKMLSLGIILRVPVEFLFPDMYDELRDRIRAEEERLRLPIQQSLFDYRHYPCHHERNP